MPLIGSQRSALSNMSETFGRPFSLLWLVRPAAKAELKLELAVWELT